MKTWLANMMLSAFLAALQMGRRRGYAYLLDKADTWRRWSRDRWWRYKLKTILSQGDPDDDMLADALGRYYKFETPPEDSHWTMERTAANSVRYLPLPGSGYILNSHGEYLPSR